VNGLYDGEFAGLRVATSVELDTALREAVVAVDANVLLNLYRYRPQTSQDLISTLSGLGNRLVVPHQALREFWRRRQRTQDSPRFATETAREALEKQNRAIHSALAVWAKEVGCDDGELSDLITRVDDFFGTLTDQLLRALPDTDASDGEDPILEQLETILAGHVTLPLETEEWETCIAEATRRVEAKKPPGYMDAEKQDSDLPEGSAGDYLVWYQATRYAKEQNSDLLIVTSDQKEDWWWRQQAKLIGPRQELALEYQNLTGKRLFLMLPSGLLGRASVLGVRVNTESFADAGRERSAVPVGNFSALRHGLTLDEEERELNRELNAIETAAAAQGWRIRTRSDTAFRVVTRDDQGYSLSLGSAAETRDRLRPFAQQLADAGLRISQTVLKPVNEEAEPTGEISA
jgi:hypothetical protein